MMLSQISLGNDMYLSISLSCTTESCGRKQGGEGERVRWEEEERERERGRGEEEERERGDEEERG